MEPCTDWHTTYSNRSTQRAWFHHCSTAKRSSHSNGCFWYFTSPKPSCRPRFLSSHCPNSGRKIAKLPWNATMSAAIFTKWPLELSPVADREQVVTNPPALSHNNIQHGGQTSTGLNLSNPSNVGSLHPDYCLPSLANHLSNNTISSITKAKCGKLPLWSWQWKGETPIKMDGRRIKLFEKTWTAGGISK